MATSLHPRAALHRVRRGQVASASERADLEVVCAAVAVVVLVAGVTITGLVALTPLGTRSAGVAVALLLAAGLSSGEIRAVGRRLRVGHLERVVAARTERELAELDRDRWQVTAGLPLGEGRTASLVADGHEAHLVVACWTPTHRAALQLRCAVAAATGAAQDIERRDRAIGRHRAVVPTVVAWGPGAQEARDRQAPVVSGARVLLADELWAWRIERGIPSRS